MLVQIADGTWVDPETVVAVTAKRCGCKECEGKPEGPTCAVEILLNEEADCSTLLVKVRDGEEPAAAADRVAAIVAEAITSPRWSGEDD